MEEGRQCLLVVMMEQTFLLSDTTSRMTINSLLQLASTLAKTIKLCKKLAINIILENSVDTILACRFLLIHTLKFTI